MAEQGSSRRFYGGGAAGALGLWAAGLIVAVSLCGTEAAGGGIKPIRQPEQFNHVLLSASAAGEIGAGRFLPRTSAAITGDLGNPYHQFYSPLPHAVAGVLIILSGDAVRGYAAGAVLFTLVSFVFAWKLSWHLTSCHVSSVAGAFLWTLAPGLLSARTMRGDFAGYAAGCLLPMALYFLLRALPARRLGPWTCSALSLAALLLTSPVVASLLFLFSAVYALLYFLCAASDGRLRRRLFRRRLARRLLTAGSAVLAGLALSLAYAGPQLFGGDPGLRAVIAASGPVPFSAAMTSALTFLSLTDVPWLQNAPPESARLQAGALLLVGAALYAFRNFRGRVSPGARPLVLTAALLLVCATSPGLLPGPEEIPEAGGIACGLILVFEAAALLMTALAVKGLVRSWGGERGPAGLAIALSAAGAALALAGPYLSPRPFPEPFPLHLDSSGILDRGALMRREGAFLRSPPGAGSPDWIPEGAEVLDGVREGRERVFRLDLGQASPGAGGAAEALLNVLYYPGLQGAEILVDGKPFSPALGTFWQARPQGTGWPGGAFHGLRLAGLPRSGLLEARVRFTGCTAANIACAAAWAGLAVLWALRIRQTLRGRRLQAPRRSSGAPKEAGAAGGAPPGCCGASCALYGLDGPPAMRAGPAGAEL
ncbi:MAG: hypothetical protein LBW85_00120 [Deltaproteobacteria bacterium]|jgi:hypothetical protein|nr:hypothetical protein [Deltaproteobacteria bacterium]